MTLDEPRILALALFFVALIVWVWAKTSYTKSKTIHLLRALFPSWKFFGEFGHLPVLLVRTRRDQAEWEAWRPCLQSPQRHWALLVYNPKANLHLACQSLVQRMISEIQEHQQDEQWSVQSSVTFELINHMVVGSINEAAQSCQFKICIRDPDESDSSLEDVLLSPVYEV